jgi:hypothetical protein
VDRATLQRAVGFDIAQPKIQPVCAALEWNASTFADRAVGAVTANQVLRTDCLLGATPVPQHATDVGCAFNKCGEFDTTLDRDALLFKVSFKNAFSFRLRHERDVRETSVGAADVTELDARCIALIDVQHQARRALPEGRERRAESE